MGWLTTEAHHGAVDVCGENMSIMKPVKDHQHGIRLLTGSTIDQSFKTVKNGAWTADAHKIFSQDEKGFDEKKLQRHIG